MDCEAGAGEGMRAASGRTRRQPVLLHQKPPRPRVFAHQPRGTLPRQFVNLGSHHFQSRSYAVISEPRRDTLSAAVAARRAIATTNERAGASREPESSENARSGASCSKVLALPKQLTGEL